MNLDELKEKYSSFLESLREKGIPKPEVVVPAAIVLLVVGVAFLLTPGISPFGPETQDVTLTVLSEEGDPVRSAAITIYNEEDESWNAVTDDYGKAIFTAVTYESLKASVEAAGYQSYRLQPVSETKKIYLQSLTPATKEVTVRVRDSLGHDVEGAQVVLLFDDGTTSAGRTDAFGEVEIDAGQADSAGTVQASADGYKSSQKTIYKYEWDSPVVIELASIQEEQVEEPASVYVIVEDEQGNALEGITISLTDYNTEAAQRKGLTDSSGVAEFTGLIAGWAFRVNAFDPANVYAAYASTQRFIVEKDGSSVSVRLEKKIADAGELRFSAVNENGEPLAGASIMVFERLTGALLAEANTDALGKATIAVAKNKAFYVTAYKEGYHPAQDEVESGETRKLVLEKAVAGSFITLTVHVKDSITGEPAPNALVTLFKADGFQLGYPAKRADADGTTTFNAPKTLKGKTYDLVAAASLGYKQGRSDAIQVFEGAELFVVLEPLPGTIKAKAVDASTGELVDDATLSLWSGDEALAECNKNPCEFVAPPEKELYLKAVAEGYLAAFTVNKIVAPGETLEVEARLYPRELAESLSISLEGIYDSKGNKVKEVSNAEKFVARFLVNVPSTELSGATAFFKIGDSTTAGEEPFAITEVNAPRAEKTDAGSYYDEECSETIEVGEEEEYAIDSDYRNWARVRFPDGFAGTTQVELELYASPSAKQGDESRLYFNAHAEKNGVPLLSPVDEALISGLLDKETLTDKDYCLAKKRSEKLVVGSDTLACRDSSCAALWFEFDGGKYKKGFEVEAGDEFQLAYEALALTAPIQAIEVGYPEELLLQSWVSEDSAGGVAQEKMSVDVAIGEKTSGKIRFIALRAVSLAEAIVTVYYEDAAMQPTSYALQFTVTGTNKFKVLLSPDSLVAGLSERVRATVLDQFSRPIEDAWITYYDCEDYPLNAQEIDVVGDATRDNGEDGKYATQLNPSSLGRIGVQVQRDGFKTYDSCDLDVLAGNFLIVEPEILEFTGTSTKLGQAVTLTSLLPIESRVSASVRCYEGLEEGKALVQVSPQSFKLEDQAITNIIVNENATAKADCYVTFTARVNSRSKAEATLIARLDVEGPPAPLCPYPYSCLTQNEASERGCQAVTAYGCAASLAGTAIQSCYACEVGPDTLPDSIELAVSNTAPTNTQTFRVSLYNAPEQCSVEGFEYAPTSQPNYQQQYPGIQQNYGNYQPNSWQTPSWQDLNVGYSMQGYYNNVGSMYEPYGYSGYGAQAGVGAYLGASAYAGIGSSYGVPAYCQQYLNMQSMYGNYQSSTYGSQTGYGYGLPSACQYPAVCQQPSLCSYSSTGSYYGNSIPYACQYPAVCQNPSACPYYSGTQYGSTQQQYGTQYASTQQQQYGGNPPVQVTVTSCNANELEVTARYTGGDYYQNAGMGGAQQGFIVVKLGPGETRRIPVTVIVEQPPYLAGYSQSMPFTPMIPPECLAGFIQPADVEGLDEYGLPTEIELFVNPHTGKAHYKREIAVIGNVLYKWKEKPKGIDKLSVSQSEIELTYENDEFEEDEGELEMWIAGYEAKTKKVPVTITEDDFTPSIIQLLATQHGGDEAVYETGEDEMECDSHAGSAKIKCKDGKITASATKYASSSKYYLEVTGLGDYQIREIPVRLAHTDNFEAPVKEGGVAEYDYRIEAGKTIAFSKSDWLAAPDCGDLTAKEEDCGTQKIVVRNDADERIYSWSPDEREDDVTVFVYGGQGECRELYEGVWEKNGVYYSDKECKTRISDVRTYLTGRGVGEGEIKNILEGRTCTKVKDKEEWIDQDGIRYSDSKCTEKIEGPPGGEEGDLKLNSIKLLQMIKEDEELGREEIGENNELVLDREKYYFAVEVGLEGTNNLKKDEELYFAFRLMSPTDPSKRLLNGYIGIIEQNIIETGGGLVSFFNVDGSRIKYLGGDKTLRDKLPLKAAVRGTLYRKTTEKDKEGVKWTLGLESTEPTEVYVKEVNSVWYGGDADEFDQRKTILITDVPSSERKVEVTACAIINDRTSDNKDHLLVCYKNSAGKAATTRIMVDYEYEGTKSLRDDRKLEQGAGIFSRRIPYIGDDSVAVPRVIGGETSQTARITSAKIGDKDVNFDDATQTCIYLGQRESSGWRDVLFIASSVTGVGALAVGAFVTEHLWSEEHYAEEYDAAIQELKNEATKFNEELNEGGFVEFVEACGVNPEELTKEYIRIRNN
ncbi:hypothetical protein COT57_02680 [Candidatus Micrarchaeota archaeon CG09_land_8_20_14_0_10_55_25]|nr:MAG: hypothetical protein AUJ15_01035 [Candidatus Micrarchaeota archaeon CG1_02_55_41]PIO02692.1 MAG: hypothetical protein COT57_02680 [Candidatus Micrarchaeota archaeon CG09_land_8_20_14_0_10_55_25]